MQDEGDLAVCKDAKCFASPRPPGPPTRAELGKGGRKGKMEGIWQFVNMRILKDLKTFWFIDCYRNVFFQLKGN